MAAHYSPSSEYSLLESIRPSLCYKKSPRFPIPIGDDAAIRVCHDREQLILTADSFVENVHFSLRYMTFSEIGYKAMAINVSDCAAMATQPDCALVQIIFPQNCPAPDISLAITQIYKGFANTCRKWKFPIIGGNLSAGPCWIIDITLLGRKSNRQRILLRKGARHNDGLWVTGNPGMSAAGLQILQKHASKDTIPLPLLKYVKAHIHPIPRIELGRALSENAAVHCAMDISDGISKDGRTMGFENKLGIILPEDIPSRRNTLSSAAAYLQKDWLELFLHGGEDYELMFAASKGFNPEPLIKKFGIPLTRIGTFEKKRRGLFIRNSLGIVMELKKGGWDHMPK